MTLQAPLAPPTLEEFEALPEFVKATAAEQQQARLNYFNTYIAPNQMFQTMVPAEQQRLYQLTINRDPVFEHEDNPTLAGLKSTIALAKTGNADAIGQLKLQWPVILAGRRSTVNQAFTWLRDNIENIVAPVIGETSQRAGQVIFGKEGDKLQALIERNVPEAAGAIKSWNLLGITAKMAESVDLAVFAGGTADAPAGFAKPIYQGLQRMVNGYASVDLLGGKTLQTVVGAGIGKTAAGRFVAHNAIPLMGETANAIGAGLGFAIEEATKMAMEQSPDDPINLKRVARDFGVNVATDYGMWALTGAAGKLIKYSKLMFAKSSNKAAAEAASDMISQGFEAFDQNPTVGNMYKILNMFSPDVAANAVKDEARELVRSLDLDNTDDLLKFVARSQGFDVQTVEENLGKSIHGKLYKVLDLATGQPVTESPVSLTAFSDLLAKTAKGTTMRFLPKGQMKLSKITKFSVNIENFTKDSDWSMFSWTNRVDDPGFQRIHYDALNRAEDLGLQTKVVSDLFDVDQAAMPAGSPEARHVLGVGLEVPQGDGLPSKFLFPELGNEAKGDSAALAGFKAKIINSILDDGVIPVPDRFMSLQQKQLYRQTVDDTVRAILRRKYPEMTQEVFNDFIKHYQLLPSRITKHDAALPERLVQFFSGVNSQFARNDLAAAADMADMAWGYKAAGGGILASTDISPVQMADGSVKFRVSTRVPGDKSSEWRTLMSGSGPRLFDSVEELRAEALRKILADGNLDQAAIQNMVSATTGYKLILAGQPIVDKIGAPAAKEHMLVLPGRFRVAGQNDLTAEIVATGRTFGEIFDKVPGLYEQVATANGSHGIIQAIYDEMNPYITIEGRAFSFIAQDILATARNLPEGGFRQEILTQSRNGFKAAYENQVAPSAMATLGASGRAPLVVSIVNDDYLVTPFVGSRTLRFGSMKEMTAYLGNEAGLLDELELAFARNRMGLEVTPAGGLIAIAEDGTSKTFDTYDQVMDYFGQDLFPRLTPLSSMTDVDKKMAYEVLGAHREFNDSLKAEELTHAGEAPLQFSSGGRNKFRNRTMVEIPMPGGRTRKIDLFKAQDFGWELNFAVGEDAAKDVLETIDHWKSMGHNLKVTASGGSVSIRVGGYDLAEGLADELDAIPGVRNGLDDSATFKAISSGGRIKARFINPDGSVAPLAEAETLRNQFRNFYSGGGSLLQQQSKEYRPAALARRIKDMIRFTAVDMPFMPVDESIETAKRLDIAGASDFWKLRQAMIFTDKKLQLLENQWNVRLEKIVKGIPESRLQTLQKMLHVAPENWAKAEARLGITLTEAEKTVLNESMNYYNDFMRSVGVNADGWGDMARTADVNYHIARLRAKWTGRDVPLAELEDMATKFSNMESVPQFIKVYSNSVRPDELMARMNQKDLKSFLQDVTHTMLDRKYMGQLRNDVAKVYFSINNAKLAGSTSYVKGWDKFVADTIDQVIGFKGPIEDASAALYDDLASGLKANIRRSKVLVDSGIAGALDGSSLQQKLSNIATFSTQGGKVFNVFRNSTQPLLMSAATGVGEILQAYEYVLDNPGYIAEKLARGQISEGLISRVSAENPLGRFRNGWLMGVENSEAVNRAVTIRAAEQRVGKFIDRYRRGLETSESFIRATGAGILYRNEQEAFMHLINANEIDAATDYLGSIWQDISQFRYGPQNMGMAFRGSARKAWGKFMNQGLSTVALYSRAVRSKANPLEGIAALGRLAAVMWALRETFKAVGVQYDGFSFLNQFDISGGPAFTIGTDLMRATKAGDQRKRYLDSAGRSAWSLVPGVAQAGQIDRVKKFLSAGRYSDALWALLGAPSRTEDQQAFLEYMKNK